MSGWYRVTVVKKSNNETVRTEQIEVPAHREPLAIGSTPDTPDAPPAVLEAAKKVLKRGEQVGAIVHITPDALLQTETPMSPEQIQAHIARLQKQLEEMQS